MPESIVHLSSVAGSPLLDSASERLGRVEDVIVRLDLDDGLPPVTGLKARIGGREMFVPADRIERLGPAAARTATTKLNLAQFDRRPGEVLLRSDILDRSLINVDTARLVRAREVELICDQGTWRVAGIDPSLSARLARLRPRRFRTHSGEHPQFVPWRDMQPFVSHVPTSRLRLAPAQSKVSELIESAVPMVSAETDLPEVACLMTDFNLMAMPVVDAENKPIGVVAVDDVLEVLVRTEWRRREGLAR